MGLAGLGRSLPAPEVDCVLFRQRAVELAAPSGGDLFRPAMACFYSAICSIVRLKARKRVRRFLRSLLGSSVGQSGGPSRGNESASAYERAHILRAPASRQNATTIVNCIIPINLVRGALKRRARLQIPTCPLQRQAPAPDELTRRAILRLRESHSQELPLTKEKARERERERERELLQREEGAFCSRRLGGLRGHTTSGGFRNRVRNLHARSDARKLRAI